MSFTGHKKENGKEKTGDGSSGDVVGALLVGHERCEGRVATAAAATQEAQEKAQEDKETQGGKGHGEHDKRLRNDGGGYGVRREKRRPSSAAYFEILCVSVVKHRGNDLHVKVTVVE